MRKYSLPDTSQRTTNIFLKIFSQNFFQIFFQNIFFQIFCQNFPQNFFSEFFFQIFLSKFSSKFFLRIFFPNFFVKIFLKIFFQNFFPNFFLKIFLKIFSGFVSRVLHARHTRVAITSCETHACFEHPTRNFSRDYINKDFFVKFFFQIFFPNFPQNSYNHEKNPAWGARDTRVSHVQNPRNKCRKNFEKNFGKKIWKKNCEKKFCS